MKPLYKILLLIAGSLAFSACSLADKDGAREPGAEPSGGLNLEIEGRVMNPAGEGISGIAISIEGYLDGKVLYNTRNEGEFWIEAAEVPILEYGTVHYVTLQFYDPKGEYYRTEQTLQIKNLLPVNVFEDVVITLQPVVK